MPKVNEKMNKPSATGDLLSPVESPKSHREEENNWAVPLSTLCSDHFMTTEWGLCGLEACKSCPVELKCVLSVR